MKAWRWKVSHFKEQEVAVTGVYLYLPNRTMGDIRDRSDDACRQYKYFWGAHCESERKEKALKLLSMYVFKDVQSLYI